LNVLNAGGRVVAMAVLWAFGARVEMRGREHLASVGPAIYIANHSSALDTVLIPWIGARHTIFVLKREAIFIPLLGQTLWLGGHVFVDRRSPKQSIAALNRLKEHVAREGLGVWIMPEGTRSKSGELGRFKRGFVHLAIATGYPVVPIVIRGAKDVWPNGTWRLKPGRVEVEVLPPVCTDNWKAASAREQANLVRESIAKALQENG